MVHPGGGSGADFQEEASVAEIQNSPGKAPHTETARPHKGVGSKRKVSGHQDGRAPKRSAVEEREDFLLNEISLVAQNFSRSEFTWRDEPLSPLSAVEETRERSGSSTDLRPTSGVGVPREETAENPRADSADTQPGSSASRYEEGSHTEESA